MKKVEVLVCYHKPFVVFNNDALKAIQLGSKLAKTDLKISRDDTGINISEKQKWYAEDTASYWSWKNSKAEIKGIFHYRRLLDLSDENGKAKLKVIEDIEDPIEFLNEMGLTSRHINELFEKYDVITQKRDTLKTWFFGNMYEHYYVSHNPTAMDVAISVIKNKYPDFFQYFDEYMKSDSGYFQNICIMRSHDFDEMCRIKFDVLSKVEEAIDKNINEISAGWRDTSRYVGFVGERITGAFIDYLKHKGRRIGEFARVDLTPRGKEFNDSRLYYANNIKISNFTLQPIFEEKDSVNIFCSCDQNYVAACNVLINSIKKNANTSDKYDIVVGYNDVKDKDLENLKKLSSQNFSVRTIDISGCLDRFEWPTQGHITKTSYTRLFIPELFTSYNKVLYLDSDMIVNHNLKELWDIPLDDFYIGVSRDRLVPTLKYTCNNEFGKNFDEHVKTKVGLTNVFNYFNAGLILLNLKLINQDKVWEEVFDTLVSFKDPVYADQDILNRAFKDKPIYWIGSEWNAQWNVTFDFSYAKHTSAYEYCIKLLENPKIIHYCGTKKPWQFPQYEYSQYFWKYAKDTEYLFDFLRESIFVDSKLNNKALNNRALSKYIKYRVLKLLTFGLIKSIKKRSDKYLKEI